MKRILFFLLTSGLSGAFLTAQTVKHAKDTIEDKSIVAPESMTENLSDLLHDWQMDFTAADNDCKQGVNVVFNDSVYMNRLSRIPSEMELSYNRVVRSYIDMYSDRRRSQVAYMLALGDYYFPMFEEMLDKYGLPLELKYLPVIESALNPIAVSRVGATGLWQFMMRTGQGYGLEVNSLVDERRDPHKATEAAARYLKDLFSIYKDWNLVIAAYNCGPGNVNKAIARSGGKRDYWEIYYNLPRETRGYVPAFIAANYIMNYYADHNICPMRTSNNLALDTVHVNQEIHFGQIADVLDIPISEIRRLNPQFKRDIIPGNYESYALNLPTKKMIAFIDKKSEIMNHQRSQYLTHRLQTDQYIRADNYASAGGSRVGNVYHRVRKGDNLSKIAKRYGTTTAQLKSWNRLRSSNIPVGKRLIVKKHAIQRSEASQTQYAQVASSNQTNEVETKSVNQYYRVKKGDTLGSIARKNRVSVAQLQSWNGLKSSKISVGKQLIVQRKTVKVEKPKPAPEGPVYSEAEPARAGNSSIISDYLKSQMNTKTEDVPASETEPAVEAGASE